jgi:phosphoserine phosphatase RsbU/P
VNARGIPIGLGETAYKVHTLRLSVGDRLYLFSDGLIEAVDGEGNCFDREKLLPALEQSRSLPLKDGLATLTQRVEQWQGALAPRDDTSILAIEFIGTATELKPASKSLARAVVL